MEDFIRSREWPMGKVMNCLRLALAGTSSGLGIADIVSLIGKDEVARRIGNIKAALTKMKIGICNDHAGVEYKSGLKRHLEEKGYEVMNFGTDTTDSMDYPDVAHPLAEAVESGKVDLGIALCGTGNGMAMTLNKHQGIRAGLAWSEDIGRLVKQHNNANVLVMPARFIPFETAVKITDAWLDTSFEGGRHQRRIDKIPCPPIQ